MKSSVNTTLFMIALLLFVSIVISCDREVTRASMEKTVFYETGSKTQFNLENQTQLNQLAKVLARESGAIDLQHASVVDLTDSQGDYKAISFSYKIGKSLTRMIVPIQADQVSGNDMYYVIPDEFCEMKCTTDQSCSGSTYLVTERCKLQSCSCDMGSASASIVFNE